ncbi:helicase HerA domain-containing protein [Halobaculum magnesiiphilum]|uniref:Type IV secretion system DNA-binding domain-containing protein n=1 Tax=Halobaculum magnesiiphilum TaxID=1017351 RepID=A0A8T8WI39_9EURY|nr:DUF87 domain-containing protein [Halobaculum magnesiiphilum]QZP39510.1 type IV secretion system DNA-binding domain-containing protein [Halobaculum magnesiiphilum]
MKIPFLNTGGYQSLEISRELFRTLQNRLNHQQNILVQTRPYKEGPGQEYGTEVIKTFLRGGVSQSRLLNLLGRQEVPGPFSFEIWFDEGHVKFVWGLPNDHWYNQHREMLSANYPKINIERASKGFPSFAPGDYVSGGYLTLDRNIYHPIKGIGEEAHGRFPQGKAAYRNITSALIGRSGTSAIAQIVFTPAEDWRSRRLGWRNAQKVSRHLKQGNFVHSWWSPHIDDPTEKELRTAEAIDNMENERAFYVNVRYFVFGESEKFVTESAAQIGNAYVSTYHNPDYDQQFRDVASRGRSLKSLLKKGVGREWDPEPGRPKDDAPNFPLTPPEIAGLAHLPNDEVGTPNIQFTRRGLGARAPGVAPRKVKAIDSLPFEEYDVGPTSPKGALSATPTELPSGNPTEPASDDAKPLEGEVDESLPDPEEWGEDGASKHVYGDASFQGKVEEPANQFDGPQREAFLKLYDRYTSEDLTVEDLRAEASSDEQAVFFSKMLEAQQEYERRNDPDGPYQGPADNLPAPAREMEQTSITPVSVEREWCFDPHTKEDRAYEVKVHDEDGEVYMGKDVKQELFDIHEDHPDSPIWLGYLKDNRVGFHEIGIEKDSWFRHLTMFGMTGMGKSTAQKNILNQIARKGYGFCYIDPKGDTVDELINELPEHRMDDIVWIEPASEDFDQVVGINFLEASKEPGTVAYNKEVSSIVDDLTAILKGGDYWGPKMEGITTNIARAMIRSPKPFTLTDMYHVIMSKPSRRAFADMIAREGQRLMEREDLDEDNKEAMLNIHSYTEKIAQMDDEEVDAVVRRIQSWVEDPLARGIVAHREGTVNITEAVEDGKIILVKIPIDSDDLKRVVSTAVMRRVWSAIQARREEEKLREPFFTFIDEFDWVESEEMDVEAMLSKARSKKMGVGLANQNPGQISDSTQDQMFANSRSMATFGIGLPKDARLLAERFGEEVDHVDIEEIPRYVMFTRVLLQDDHEEYLSPPMPVNTFADYPPVRTRDESKDRIRESLDTHGVPPLESNINETAMLIHNLGNDEATQRQFLQSIREVQLERNREAVALGRVTEVFEERTGRDIQDYPNGLAVDTAHFNRYVVAEDSGHTDGTDDVAVDARELVEGEAPPGSLTVRELTGEENDENHLIANTDGAVSLTDEGLAFILAADEGSFETTDTHRELLAHGFDWFSRAGFRVSILAQQHKTDISDAEGELPGDLDKSSPRALKRSIEEMEETFELAYSLGDSQDITLEAEASLTKPAGPLHNLQRGVNTGKKVFFLVRDGRANNRSREHHADRLHGYLSDPPLASRTEVYEDESGNTIESTILYNRTEFLDLSDEDEPDKYALIEKGNSSLWEWNGATLRLFNGKSADATERGRLDGEKLDDPSTNAFDRWCRYDMYEDEWVVYLNGREELYDSIEELEEDWQRVRKPFLPEHEFETEPTEDDWEIVIVPTDHGLIEKPTDAMPRLYDGEDHRPLIAEEYWDDTFTQTYEPSILRGFGGTSTSDDEGVTSEHQGLYNTVSRKFISAQRMRDEDASLPSIERNHTASVDYGGKDPLSRVFWEQVWKRYGDGIDFEQPMDASTLKKAIKGAQAMTSNRDQAIEDAVLAGQLIHTDIGFFLAPPRGNHVKLVLRGNAEEYIQREGWEEIWDHMGALPGETLPEMGFNGAAVNNGPFTGVDAVKPRVRAAVKASIDRGTLEVVENETPDGRPITELRLPARDPPEEWTSTWAHSRVDQDEYLKERLLYGVLKNAHGLTLEEAKVEIERAEETNVLIKEGEFYRLNDPHDNSTPQIDWDTYFEDEDSDGAGRGKDDGGVDEAPDIGGGPTEPPRTDQGQEDSPTESNEGRDVAAGSVSVNEVEVDSHGRELEKSGSSREIERNDAEIEGEKAAVDTIGQVETTDDDFSTPDAETNGARTDPETLDSQDPPASDSNDQSDTDAPTTVDLSRHWPEAGIIPDDEPEGWKDAFADATDYYHEQLDSRSTEKVHHNRLLDHIDATYRTPCTDVDREAVDTDADPSTIPEHSTYVASCPFCTVEATCRGCGRDRAVARFDATPCSHDDDRSHKHSVVEGSCDHCVIDPFCPDCVAIHEATHDDPEYVPIETLDEDEPVTIVWNYLSTLGVDKEELETVEGVAPTDPSVEVEIPVRDVPELTDEDGEPLSVSDLPPTVQPGVTRPESLIPDDEGDDAGEDDAASDGSEDGEEDEDEDVLHLPVEWGHDEPTVLVEHYQCFNDHRHEPADCGMCPSDITTAEPFMYLPESAGDYFTGPHWEDVDVDTSLLGGDDANAGDGAEAAEQPFGGYSHHTINGSNDERNAIPATIGRRWDAETVAAALVGWAPASKQAGLEELAPHYTPQQLIATGLFQIDWSAIRDALNERVPDEEDEVLIDDTVYSRDVREAIEDIHGDEERDIDLWGVVRELDTETLLRSRWRGRYVFPYFDENGNPVHALSRVQKGKPHSRDLNPDAKYQKIPGYDGIASTEPIYGTHTLRRGVPVVITEGIADAIAAHAHGIPCLSPVTVQFKDRKVERLLEIIEEYDIPTAYVVQDNEQASFTYTGDGADDSDIVEVDVDEDEDPFATDEGAVINAELDFEGVAPGEKGALKTAKTLDDNGIGAFLIEIPRIAGRKVDLDDYLSQGLYEVAPPLPHLTALLEKWRREDDDAELRDSVGSSGLRRLSARAGALTDGLSAGETELLDLIGERRAFTDQYGQQVTAFLEEHHTSELETDGDEDVTVRGLPEEEPAKSDIPAHFEEFPHMDYAGTGLDEDGLMAIVEWDIEYGIPRVPIGEYIDFAEAKTAFATADGAGWEAVVEDVDLAEYRPPSLAKSGLGAYLTLGRHVTMRGTGSIHRDVTPFGTVESDSDHESDAESLRVEPLFEGHTITHPTAHDAYDDLQRSATYSQWTERTESFASDPHEDLESGANAGYNEFYDQNIVALTGLDIQERGPNPLSHVGDSENYFMPLDRFFAYDHKRKCGYNPLTYMACMAKVRPPSDPAGPFTDEEELHTWVRIKKNTGILSTDAKVPMKLFNAAAIELGTASSEDIQPVEHTRKDRDNWTREEIVDPEKWNATVDAFEEEFGVDSGIRKQIVEEDLLVDGMTKEESFEAFAEHHITDVKPDWDERDTDQATVKTKYAWAAYEEFCEVNGVDPRPQGDWPELVEEIGCEKKRMTLNRKRRRRLVGATLTPTGWMMKKRRLGSDGPRD